MISDVSRSLTLSLRIFSLCRSTGDAHIRELLKVRGWGIIDDMPAFELLKIINKIDRDGKSDFEITSELGNVMIWNCRNYRTDCDNYLLKGDAESIRYGYEEYED